MPVIVVAAFFTTPRVARHLTRSSRCHAPCFRSAFASRSTAIPERALLSGRERRLSTAYATIEDSWSAAASTEELVAPPTIEVDSEPLLRPQDFHNGTIPLPQSLSPSSISCFQQCPQSFLFQYIYGLKQPVNAALAKGSMCHAALERLFDLEPTERSLPVLENLFRSVWSENRGKDGYVDLFGTSHEEAVWGRESLQLLHHYWQAEDAAAVTRPNPVQREVWVSAKVSTALSVQDPFATLETDSSYPDTVLVRGIIDRLDMTQINGEVCLRLIDYKTGKAPAQHYSPPTNARIREEAFSALYLYALLLRESHRAKRKEAEEKTNGSTTTTNNNYLPVRFVQLFYLNDAYGRAVRWEEDIGATEDQRDAKLWEEQQHVARVYRNMWELVQQQDPKAWSGCNRSFCYCHKCRGRFVPDTVWEPAA